MRLGRDHYVRLDANDYSVHPSVIGHKLTITADLNTVRIRCDTALVAEHQRCWAAHQSISDPVQVAAAADLRRRRHTVAAAPDDARVACRDLAHYDRLLGLPSRPPSPIR